MEAEIRIRHEELIAGIRQVLAAEGVPAAVREVEAEVMAEADLLGVSSHGVRLLPGLVKALREGRSTRDPRLRLLRERGATCVMDGENGPGRYVSVRAMQHAVERAKDFGAGVCLATRTMHWGRAHAYAYRAARSGMIGLCTTNAIPNMLGWGSTRPVLGNNPLAIAVPRGPDRDPIVLDLAMSQAAVGKVATFMREGRLAPRDWGLNSSGQPTSDPEAILASGKLLPMGGHKGAGLALMMELLTGALSGGLLSQEVLRADSSKQDPNASKFFLALDVEAFVERDRFLQKTEEMLSFLRETVEPGKEALYPGERGWKTRDCYLVEGIPLHAEIAAQLQKIGMPLPRH